MRTVLVTGAAGTVGSYVATLAEAKGLRVIASDRTGGGVRTPVRGEVRLGDLRDPQVLAGLVKGVDAVIHTAAQQDAYADVAELSEVNTTAVTELYRAAKEAGAKRFVHVSTAMLYTADGVGGLTEQSPIAARGPQGMSKLGAETFLTGCTEGPAWTILRPAPIYGRRGRHFSASLLSVGPMMRLTTPLLPRPKGGPMGTMVHAEDVASALLFVLDCEDAHGRIFNVSDGHAMSLGARLADTFEAYGLRMVPTAEMPRDLLDRVGRFFERPGAYRSADVTALALWKLVVLRHKLKPALHPRLDREAMTLLSRDMVVDAGALKALGWRPRYADFRDGMRQVLRWYQAERWVPRYHA